MEKSIPATASPRLFPFPSQSTTRKSTLSTSRILGAFLFASIIFVVSYIYSQRAVEFRNALCLRGRSRELAKQISCGDRGLLEDCLRGVQADSNDIILAELEECFENVGCESPEARLEAGWVWMNRCYDYDSGRAKNDGGNDSGALFKRQAGATTNNAAATTAAAATTSAAQVETVIVTASDSTTTANAAATTTNPTTGRPPVCFTTTMIDITTCPIETTGARSGKPGSCFPTTAPSSVCAAGLICRSDSQGNPSCMYANNSFGAAGVVIALFFAISITAAICLLIFLCCRERREQTRVAKAAEAAAIAKDAKNAAVAVKKRPSIKVRSMGAEEDDGSRPLMAQQQQQYAEASAPSRGYGIRHDDDEGMYGRHDAPRGYEHGNDDDKTYQQQHPQIHGYGGGHGDPFADQNRIR